MKTDIKTAGNPERKHAFCDICGYGCEAAEPGQFDICYRHTPEAVQQWRWCGAITYTRREELCLERAGLNGIEEELINSCRAPSRPNFQCPGCPFFHNWMYSK